MPVDPVTGSRLPRCDTAYDVVTRGACGVWLNADTLCGRPLGHLAGDLPHRGYDPSGSGRWIDYDDAGNEVARSE